MERARRRVAELGGAAHADDERGRTQELLQQTLLELTSALEALEVSSEELRAQNESLRESRTLLEQERIRYHELFDFAPDAYVVTDAEARICEVNRAGAELFGRPADHLIGTSLPDWLSPREATRLSTTLAAVEREGRVDDVRLRLRRRAGGAATPVSVSVARSAAPGAAPEYLWLIRDVSARLREEERGRQLAAERAARAEAEEAGRLIVNILENISDGFVALDHEARIVYMNRRAELLMGRSREELLGRVGWEEYPELEDSIFEREYRRAVEQGASVSIEEYFAPLRGWVELHAFPTPDGLTIYFRNISGRKRAEANQRFLAEASTALATSIDYETTLDTVTGLAVPHLADSCILYILEAGGEIRRARSIHSDPEKDARLRGALSWLPTDPRLSNSPVTRVIETGEALLIPDLDEQSLHRLATSPEHLQALREIAPESLIVVPMVSRGRTFGALSLGCSSPRDRYTEADTVLAGDLAARAALALDNARLYDATQRAARARQEVLHVVSHDLRNSLNAALLHIDVLLSTAPALERGERGRAQVVAIQRAARQMQRLVQDLLDVESIQAGRLSIRPEPAAAGDLVDEAVQVLRPLAEEHRLDLQVHLPAGLPPLHADAGRIQQVLTNLVGNAIKFSHAGGRVRVEVRREASPGGGEVHFRVVDTGPGIAPDELPFVFERYWQGSASRQTGRGAGLGLTIARGIVEAHGGRIWAESTVGEGSTFTFALPLAMEDPRD